MSNLWAELLPLLLAMLIAPGRIIAVILLLHTPRRAYTASSFVAGMMTAMLLQGLILAGGFRLVGLTADERAGDLDTVIAVLFTLGGLILLVGAARFLFSAGDDDGPAPAWLEKLETMAPGQALKTGLGWLFISPKQWVFELTAVAVIFAADLEPVAGLANYLLFTLLVQTVFFLILGVHLLLPRRSEAILDRLFSWLRAHLQIVAGAIFSTFGVVFLIKGLSQLAG